MSLTDKQQRFVAEYLKDLNATQAAIRTGYSPKTAQEQGSRLLSNAMIAQAVSDGAAKRLDRAELTAVRVLEEMRRIAFSDIQGLFDAAGNLKPIHELTPDQAAAIASIEVVKKNVAAGDGQVDTIHKIKVWDKPKVLDMLGKHFGLLIEKVEHSGEVACRWLNE